MGILVIIGLAFTAFCDLNVPGDALSGRSMDSDFDGLSNTIEMSYGTNSMDADSDDDGIKDGEEVDWNQDSDGDKLINALDPDSDNDCVTDGTEVGVDAAVEKVGEDIDGTDTKATIASSDRKSFTADADPATTTDMTEPDTDGDGLLDGWEDKDGDYKYDIGEEVGEDINYNGKVDADECCPNHKDTDGGGVSDDEEIELGGDPADEADDDGLFDNDGDGVINREDAFPDDKSQTVDSDGDGHGDNLAGTDPDEFPTDKTQWKDSDSDGYGDNPEGANADAFPNEMTQWKDSDGDGFGDNPLGVNADAFPDDPAASKDMDSDGFPDEWNQGKTEADSVTGLMLDNYPTDAAKWKKPESDSGDSFLGSNLVPVSILAVLGVVAFIISTLIFIQKKRSEDEEQQKKDEMATTVIAMQKQFLASQTGMQQQVYYGYPNSGVQQVQTPHATDQSQVQRGLCKVCGQTMRYQDYSKMFYCMNCNRYQ